MAITIITTPATHTPCFNDQWFTATSSQTAQANFQFYVTVTVHYHNGTTWTTNVNNEAINTPPDGILRFNARSYGEKYIKHYIPISATGWNRCLNGVLKIVVNVGERYGSTPAVYTGSNQTYYVWNASLTYEQMVGYAASNYVASNGSAFPILNDYPDTKSSTYSQNFLYILAESDNVIQKARITSTDGSSIYTFDITNTLLASGNWYDRYLSLNVSPRYLSVVGGVNWGGVVGTQYSVQLYDNTGTLRKTVVYDYSSVCTQYYRYQLIYLNHKGAFDHFNFELISEEEYDIVSSKVKTTPYSDPSGAGTMTLLNWTQTEKVNNVQVKKSLKLNSNILSEAQSLTLKDLVTSPVVYLQDLDSNQYTYIYAVNNALTKYKRVRNFNNKVPNLLADVDMSYVNNRQKGA